MALVDRDRRLDFLGLTERDEQLLTALRPLFERHVATVVDAFYEHLQANPETAALLGDPATVARALRQRVPLEGNTIKASRELVELERFKIPDDLHAEARRFLKTGRQDRPAGMDGLDFKNGAPLWVRMRERQSAPDRVEVMALRIGPVA